MLNGKEYKFTLIICHRRIGESIECSKSLNIVPDVLIIRMEDMSTIVMDINAFNVFGIHISCNIRPLVNHKD